MSKLEKKYYPLVFVVPALIIFTLCLLDCGRLCVFLYKLEYLQL